jgi:branched-chain amino acid aminotransferase
MQNDCPIHAPQKIMWLNGDFIAIEKASISPLDRGLLFGDGVFETIRAEDGRTLYLDLHLERLYDSLEALRITIDPPEWGSVLGRLLLENELMRGAAAIKILVTRGIADGPGIPCSGSPTVCIMARQYCPPPPLIYQRGWRLHIFKGGLAPPLARFKSLNYLFYHIARQTAFDAGADEAILLDCSGLVTETSAGSLLARTNNSWWTPRSEFQLPGTTIRKVIGILERQGISVQNRPVRVEDFLSAHAVWVLNSLIGIMPVSEIDGNPVPNSGAGEAAKIRDELFGGLSGAPARFFQWGQPLKKEKL